MDATFNLQSLDFAPAPFPHFVAHHFLATQIASSVLAWFIQGADWTSVGNGTSRYLKTGIPAKQGPDVLETLAYAAHNEGLIERMEEVFGVHLARRVELSGMRFPPYCQIGAHTDFGSRNQSHRIVISLSPGWIDSNGGELVLLEPSTEPHSLKPSRVLPPLHNRAVGFEISRNSFHRVEQVKAGDRHSLALYFFSD